MQYGKNTHLLQYFVSFIISLLIESPLILIWLLFFLLPLSQLLVLFFDPEYPFLPEKNHHHHCKKYRLLAHGVHFIVPGAVGFYQVSLAFFPDVEEKNIKQEQQKTKIHTQTQKLYFVSFLIFVENEKQYSKDTKALFVSFLVFVENEKQFSKVK